MKKNLFPLLCALLAMAVQTARADEIDVYVDCTSSASTTWTGQQTTLTSYYGYDNSGAVEYYVASDSTTYPTLPLYQTISGLEAGEYQVMFYATAHLASWNGAGAWTDTSSSKTGVAYAFATTGGTSDFSSAQTEDLPIWYATSLTSDEPYTFSFTVDVEEGDEITIGIYTTQEEMWANWFTAQIIALYKVETVELGDDVTDEYIGEPGFENCTASSAGGDGASESYSGTGWSWTHTASSSYAAGAVLAYGDETAYVGNSSYHAPSEAWDADEGTENNNALGVQCRWNNAYSYYTSETTTLPAGTYTMVVHTYNSNTGSTSFPVDDYIGFVPTSGTASYCGLVYFEGGEWDVAAVSFTLGEETEGAFRLGYGTMGNYGSGNTPELFFDDLTLYYTALATTYDISEYVVGSPNWGFESCEASTASFSGSYDHGDYTDTGWTAITNYEYGRGGVLAYGAELYCNSSTYGIVPSTGWDETTITDNENTLGMGCSWTHSLAYSSDTISLPAGTYKISVHTYNSSTAATSITANLTGFVALDGTTYYIDNTSFTSSTWETSSVEFTLTEETAGYVSVGIQGPGAGSGDAPVIYFDDITLVTETEYSDESPITTIGTLTANIEDGETLATAPTSISFGWVGGWTTSTSLSTSSIGALSTSVTATLTASGSSTSTTVTFTYDSDTGLFTADVSGVSFSQDVVYTLTIPAGIYGWSGTSNEETTISFSITSFETGTYVFQVKGEYKYLSHGGSWGTQVVAGEMGIPFTVELASGGYTLLDADRTTNEGSNKYIYLASSGGYYLDGASPAYWQIASADGGYYLLTADGSYIGLSEEVTYSDYYHYQYLTTVDSQDDAVVWVLHEKDASASHSLDAFDSYYETIAAMKDAQAAVTAKLAGLSGVTSMADMASLGYDEYDCTWAIQNAALEDSEGWTAVGSGPGTRGHISTYELTSSIVVSYDRDGLVYCNTSSNYGGGFYQSISGLPEGIYRVRAVGGYNPTTEMFDLIIGSVELSSTLSSILSLAGYSYDLTDDEKTELSPAWMYANSGSQRTVGRMDGYKGEVATVSSTSIETESILSNFADTMYVYVGEGETLTIGGQDPGNNTSLFMMANWELTFLHNVSCKLGSYTTSIEDGETLSSFESLTVSYPYAWTTDSTNYASCLVLNSSGVSLYAGTSEDVAATGTVTLTDDGFKVTFSDYTLRSGVTYTITIAEDTYGYVSNTTVSGAANEEISITFYIPSVEDGVYYLKAVTDDDEDEYSYLSHGSSWGTRATADSYGLPVQVEADENGATFYFADNQGYLFDDNSSAVFTDGSTSKYYNWSVVQSSENDTCYVIASSNDGSSYDGYYLSISDDGNVDLVSSESDATLWYFETPAVHKAVMQTYKDNQAVTAATDASIISDDVSITSASDLVTWLSENRTEVIITPNEQVSTISESWQKNAGYPTTDGSSTTGYNLVTDAVTLSEGFYKLSLQGLTRYASNSVTETLEGARSLVFLRVTVGENIYETQLLSVLDYAATTAWNSDEDDNPDYEGTTGDYSGYYFPNGTTGASAAFDEGVYANDVYFYVSDDDTEVSIALTDEHVYAASAGEWICYQYLTLTRYAVESETDNYYLRTTDDDDNYLYLSRGADYNSRIIADEYGLPVQVTTADDITTLYFIDNQQYVYEPLDGTVYGDASTNVCWTLSQNDDQTGYYLQSANMASSYNGYYVTLDDDGYFTLTESESDATLWTLEDPADHNDNADKAHDRQALNAAYSAGIDIPSISTRDALATYLASNYTAVDIDLTTTQSTVTEDYQGGATYGWNYSLNTLATQTATLSEGLYKFSVQGFHRFTWNGATEDLGGARGQVFLYAGSEKVNLLSPFDYEASSYTATDTYQSGSNYYPNGQSSASEAFTAGYYPNDVYFYVSTDDTDVTLSLVDEQGYGSVDIGQWTCWQNFSLVQYVSSSITITMGAGGKSSLYYGELNLEVPDGVTAYYVSTVSGAAGDSTATLVPIENNYNDSKSVIPANTGVIISGTANTEYTFPVVVSDDISAISGNLLYGSDEATSFSNSDSLYYKLSRASNTADYSTLGFYWDSSDGHSISNGAHKAYLRLEPPADGSTVKALSLSFPDEDGDATGISTATPDGEATAVEGIYTLAGVRMKDDVDSLPAGLYIINGKKVLIK